MTSLYSFSLHEILVIATAPQSRISRLPRPTCSTKDRPRPVEAVVRWRTALGLALPDGRAGLDDCAAPGRCTNSPALPLPAQIRRLRDGAQRGDPTSVEPAGAPAPPLRGGPRGEAALDGLDGAAPTSDEPGGRAARDGVGRRKVACGGSVGESRTRIVPRERADAAGRFDAEHPGARTREGELRSRLNLLLSDLDPVARRGWRWEPAGGRSNGA